MKKRIKEMLSNRKTEIQFKILELNKELDEILEMQAALFSAEDEAQEYKNSWQIYNNVYKGRLIDKINASKMTIKEMIIGVLEERPEGATAQDIIEHIKKKYGQDIPRSSLSPQLSRLKENDEKIEWNNEIWKLRKNVSS